jgi:hypothetical protein
MLPLILMQISAIFQGLGEDSFGQLLRGVSMGRLRTYQLFDRVKTRAHLHKLNQENLRKAAPRLWARIGEGDQELAGELSQAILVSHLDMIVAVLDFLEVPHNDGFFDKDANIAGKLGDGWSQRAYDKFKGTYPDALLLFYLNHLASEVDENAGLFQPAEVN